MSRGQLSRTEPRKSLVGNKYYKLTVVALHQYIPKQNGKNRKILWLCDCDCGTKGVIAEHSNLITGNRKSCGCMRKETLEKMWNGNLKEESFINAIYREYRGNANKRDLAFNITKDVFLSLIKSNCFYCGAPPSREKKLHSKRIGTKKIHSKNSFSFNGIDRIKSDEGYTENNVVPCCTRCNIAKNDMSYEEFVEWVKRIFHHLIYYKNGAVLKAS